MEKVLINPFQPSVVFHIETSQLLCRAKEITGFLMRCNTGLEWVKGYRGFPFEGSINYLHKNLPCETK